MTGRLPRGAWWQWSMGLAAALVLAPVWLPAQQGGPGTGGLVRLAQQRQALQEGRRVLVIGAHPDDEDTELITRVQRGMESDAE